jgi:DNA polymerase III subunit delta
MVEKPPVVYFLHGDDEFEITQFVANIKAKLGDSAMADMNTIELDGRSASLEEIETATATLPFLVNRRLVILTNPSVRLTTEASQKRFTALLDRVPPAIALVLAEPRLLVDDRDRKRGKLHWLEKWANQAGDRVLVRFIRLPKDNGAMVKVIKDQAKEAGGKISGPAAGLLASLIGKNPRQANQELHKLLAYVNYSRTIEVEDVEAVTADQGQGDIFALVDAIGLGDGRRAVDMLHRLLDEQDFIPIFGMVVRQFRLLLLLREHMDEGGQLKDAAKALGLHPYVAEKVSAQARRFTMTELEMIYRRLLEIDEAMKTGGMEGDLALDLLIAGVTR